MGLPLTLGFQLTKQFSDLSNGGRGHIFSKFNVPGLLTTSFQQKPPSEQPLGREGEAGGGFSDPWGLGPISEIAGHEC